MNIRASQEGRADVPLTQTRQPRTRSSSFRPSVCTQIFFAEVALLGEIALCSHHSEHVWWAVRVGLQNDVLAVAQWLKIIIYFRG